MVKIAIISDTHDRKIELKKLIELFWQILVRWPG